MAWRDHLLRLLARGMLTSMRGGLDAEVFNRVVDKIAADPALSSRLDALSEEDVRVEFLSLYENEVSGDRG